MEIKEVKQRTEIIEPLLEVWQKSVRSTHHFLSEEEIVTISQYVPSAFENVPHFIVSYEEQKPVAFMGLDGERIEMLFIDPICQGRGIGKKLIQIAIQDYGANEVCVNEQNPQAKGFYEHLGFHVYKRSEYDEQGNPYPLLYMKLDINGNDLLNQY